MCGCVHLFLLYLFHLQAFSGIFRKWSALSLRLVCRQINKLSLPYAYHTVEIRAVARGPVDEHKFISFLLKEESSALRCFIKKVCEAALFVLLPFLLAQPVFVSVLLVVVVLIVVLRHCIC